MNSRGSISFNGLYLSNISAKSNNRGAGEDRSNQAVATTIGNGETAESKGHFGRRWLCPQAHIYNTIVACLLSHPLLSAFAEMVLFPVISYVASSSSRMFKVYCMSISIVKYLRPRSTSRLDAYLSNQYSLITKRHILLTMPCRYNRNPCTAVSSSAESRASFESANASPCLKGSELTRP